MTTPAALDLVRGFYHQPDWVYWDAAAFAVVPASDHEAPSIPSATISGATTWGPAPLTIVLGAAVNGGFLPVTMTWQGKIASALVGPGETAQELTRTFADANLGTLKITLVLNSPQAGDTWTLPLVTAEGNGDVDINPEIMASVAVTVAMVKDKLRDYPQYNELTRQEMPDDDYGKNIIDAVAEFNAYPPVPTDYTVTDFPDRKLLLDMAVVEAAQALIRWHARNQFSATDGGVQVPVHEQWGPLLQVITAERQRNDERLRLKKMQINILFGYGDGMGSPVGFGPF